MVGGGIAGLSAAWELRDRDVLVLEADDRVGGRLMSEPCGRYWLNFGGHVLAGEDSATGRLLAAAGVAAEAVPGVLTALAMNGRVLAGGRVETYPLRLRLRRSERLALIRAGARVRLAVREYARVSRRRGGRVGGRPPCAGARLPRRPHVRRLPRPRPRRGRRDLPADDPALVRRAGAGLGGLRHRLLPTRLGPAGASPATCSADRPACPRRSRRLSAGGCSPGTGSARAGLRRRGHRFDRAADGDPGPRAVVATPAPIGPRISTVSPPGTAEALEPRRLRALCRRRVAHR